MRKKFSKISWKAERSLKFLFNILILLTALYILIHPEILYADDGKNYIYRTKDGRILLTDVPQREDYATLLKVFESRKEKFFQEFGEYYKNKYTPLVKKYAMLNGLDAELVHAVIEVESGYDFTAVSPAGAKGLMQLIDETAEDKGVTNVFDPEQNISAGTEYLAEMIDRYGGNLNLALASYNAGPTTVDRYNGVPPYKETKRYIKKINRLLKNKTVIPKYKSKKEPENRRSLTWKKVNGKIVITSKAKR